MHPLKSRRPSLALALLLILCACPTHSPAAADTISLDDAVQQLADRVATIPNLHRPLHLQFFQDPNFAAETGKDWQDTLRTALATRHISFADDPSATILRVGVAETPTQIVLCAAIQSADTEQVRFLTIPRIAFRVASLPVVPIRIERQLVYQSPGRILDASSLWNGSEAGMVLLTAHNSTASIQRLDAAEQPAQTISLPPAAMAPSRDPRGELIVRGNDGVAFLPTKTCEFSWSQPSETKCHASKPMWRAPTVLSPPCSTVGWKLLDNSSDWQTPDVLQVLPDSPSRLGSAALLTDLPGPIVAINGAQDPTAALVVAHNLRTGNYEVYKITLACGN